MRLTIPEPDITLYKDGFDERNFLGRKETGKSLSELVERIEDPLVIALDGNWGSGKSFFLKRWVGEHLKEEHKHNAQTVYFDAFEHDFMDDPLIALTGVIAERFEEEEDTVAQKAWKKAKDVAPFLARTATRVTLAVATQGVSELAGPAIGAAAKAGSDQADEATKTFWQKENDKRAAMKNFKQALTDLTTPEKEGQPAQKLVIVIDELDRCRPDYALSVLEVIKHFFSVDNVHFVLGVNMKELENSVRARYGDRSDAQKYLQKFVNLTMTLGLDENPVGLAVAEAKLYLHKTSEILGISDKLRDLVEQFLDLPGIASRTMIRDVQQILSRVILLPNDFEEYGWPYQYLILTSIFLAVLDPRVSAAFKKGTADQDEVFAFLEIDAPNENSDWPRAGLWQAVHVFLADEPDAEYERMVKEGARLLSRSFKTTMIREISRCLDRFTIE